MYSSNLNGTTLCDHGCCWLPCRFVVNALLTPISLCSSACLCCFSPVCFQLPMALVSYSNGNIVSNSPWLWLATAMGTLFILRSFLNIHLQDMPISSFIYLNWRMIYSIFIPLMCTKHSLDMLVKQGLIPIQEPWTYGNFSLGHNCRLTS